MNYTTLNEEKDLLEFAFRRMIHSEGDLSNYGKVMFSTYSKVAKLPNFGVSFNSSKSLIIDGARIYNALGGYAKSHCHLLMRVRDPLKLVRIPKSLTFSLKGYKSIIKAWEKNDSSYLSAQLDFFRRVLEDIGPAYCVVNSTLDPVSRLLILASKKLGIRTACVQHGVYYPGTPKESLEEDLVDIYFSLNESQKKILSFNIPKSKIISIGKAGRFDWVGKTSAAICLVGTDIERYDMLEQKNDLLKVYKSISNYLESEHSCRVFYKPHPSETINKDIKESFNIISSNEYKNLDFFIGSNSTLLMEMSSIGKPTVQILGESHLKEGHLHFEEHGYCKSFFYGSDLNARLAECIRYGGVFPRIESPALYDVFKTHNII